MEPVIGHMKSDGRLARNFLKGIEGDAMNALLCGAGHNMRKILKKLRLLCAQLSIALWQFLNNTIACTTRLMPQAIWKSSFSGATH